MTAGALRRARLHDLDRVARRSRPAWDAPGIDPRLLKAVAADLRRADAGHRGRAVLLDVLDADAVGRADLRSLRRRPLQHRAAQLRSGGRRRSRPPGWRAALYHVLPDLSAFDVKTQVVHGLPVTRRLRAVDRGYGLAYIAALLLRRDGHLRAAGLQVTRGRRRWRRAAGVARRIGAGRWRSRCRSAATARIRARDAPRRAAALRPLGTGGRAARARRSTRIAADVYWIRAIQHYGGDRLSPPTGVSATSCCSRCSISRRRSIRTSTSPTASARSSSSEQPPGGPGRPDLAIALLEKGIAAQPDQVGVSCTTSRSSTTGTARPGQAAADWFRRAAAHAGRAELAAAAGRDDAERGAIATSARVAVAADPAVGSSRGCADRASAACCSSTRSIRSTSCRRRSIDAGMPAGRASRGSIWCARRDRAAIPLDPAGVPYCSIRTPAQVTLSAESPLNPMPDLPGTTLR